MSGEAAKYRVGLCSHGHVMIEFAPDDIGDPIEIHLNPAEAVKMAAQLTTTAATVTALGGPLPERFEDITPAQRAILEQAGIVLEPIPSKPTRDA